MILYGNCYWLKGYKKTESTFTIFNKEDDMTTDNQTNNYSIEIANYSKATTLGRNVSSKAVEKPSALKTLSLRPTKSVKKNNSFKPSKKTR